jgi:hypothetical protein
MTLCEGFLSEHRHTLHSFNIHHVKVLDRAFDACIDLGEWQKAIQYGVELITSYR